MRSMVVVVGIGIGGAGCAATSRVCPSESRLVTEERPTGRAEWCRREAEGLRALPVPGRDYKESIAMFHPPPRGRGMEGPFTHWYPSGGIESHGAYVEDGAQSVPDGVWGLWYEDGKRKRIGRYDRGRPVGCFAEWDEQGRRTTGIVVAARTSLIEGERIHDQPCEPPDDDAIAHVEGRTRGLASRGRGDATLRAAAQGGAFGVANATQLEASPAAVAAAELTVRKRLGRVRIGPAVGMRLSDGSASAYHAAAVVAVGARLHRRIESEAEIGLGAQYVELAARRTDTLGTAQVAFWAPLLSARVAGALTVTPSFQLVAGVRVDGAPRQEAVRDVKYNVFTPPMRETWTVGGAVYGVDVGLRLLMR